MAHTNTQVQEAIDQQYDGDQAVNVGYDDIQGGVSSSRRFDVNPPADREYDYGISSGVDFACAGFAVDEGVYLTVQSPHAMKLNSALEQHFHWTVPTSASGKKIKFQLDVIASGVDGAWVKPASSPFTVEVTLDGTENTKHNLAEFGEIEAANTTVSSLYKMKFHRIAASSDEYSGEVYVDFIDGHFQQDQARGSRTEYVK
jgi:hypothetical protein